MSQVARAWYSVEVAPPPLNIIVLVQWTGRPSFEASRVRHPENGRLCWLVNDAGRPVFLPMAGPAPDQRRPWAGWHTLQGQPDFWSPIAPDKWKEPLPAPAFVSDGKDPETRMWSSTTRFAAVDDAEAADLAGEMERDRAEARARKPREEAEPPERQWWIDPTAVSYSQPGRISAREAEGRIMRAVNTEAWSAVDSPQGVTSSPLSAMSVPDPLSAADLAIQDPPRLRIEPTGRDRDDFAVVITWLRGVYSRDLLIMWLRGEVPALSWREIGRKAQCHREVARKRYRRGILSAIAQANGQATPTGVETHALLAKVQNANQEFKRGTR